MRTQALLRISGVLLFVFAASLSWAEPGAGPPSGVTGDYVEARNCDVWVGPCFANGEINLRGSHAVLAWSVRKGVWEGARIDGLKIAASLDAEGTLGTKSEGRVRAVIYIDKRAGEEQAKALVALAKRMAPSYLDDVVDVQKRRISFSRKGGHANLEVGRARGKRGAEVKVTTRPLYARDRKCGNEAQAYPALVEFARTTCAKVITHFYRGAALGPSWSDPGTKGAMTGSFEIPAPIELTRS